MTNFTPKQIREAIEKATKYAEVESLVLLVEEGISTPYSINLIINTDDPANDMVNLDVYESDDEDDCIKKAIRYTKIIKEHDFKVEVA